MPRAEKIKPWTSIEINKVLRFLDDNFDLWNQNHTSACDKAIEFHKLDRDSKSVNNKIYNMMKVMDDKTKKKSSSSLQSRTTFKLLKSLRDKTKKRGETMNTNQMNTEVLSRISLLSINDTANNLTENVNNKNKKLKELTDEINMGLSELKDMEENVSKQRSELEDLDKKVSQHRSKLEEMEEEASQQRSDLKDMEKEKKELEKFFYELSKK